MKRVSPDDLRGISSKIYDEGFLQINLSDIKEEIEQVNWVKSVSLERRWPDQINILIEEEDIIGCCLLYTSPSPRDLSTSRMPSSA